MCDLKQCDILASVDSDKQVQPPVKFRTSKDVRSEAKHSLNIQATSKGSDQTARKCRLICCLAGCTYHIVGNLMHWLKSLFRMYGCTFVALKATKSGFLIFSILVLRSN